LAVEISDESFSAFCDEHPDKREAAISLRLAK
jgi:hypothetical protein